MDSEFFFFRQLVVMEGDLHARLILKKPKEEKCVNHLQWRSLCWVLVL